MLLNANQASLKSLVLTDYVDLSLEPPPYPQGVYSLSSLELRLN